MRCLIIPRTFSSRWRRSCGRSACDQSWFQVRWSTPKNESRIIPIGPVDPPVESLVCGRGGPAAFLSSFPARHRRRAIAAAAPTTMPLARRTDLGDSNYSGLEIDVCHDLQRCLKVREHARTKTQHRINGRPRRRSRRSHRVLSSDEIDGRRGPPPRVSTREGFHTPGCPPGDRGVRLVAGRVVSAHGVDT